MSSPLGLIHLKASTKGVTEVRFIKDGNGINSNPNDHIVTATQELSEYFSGHRKIFDVPLDAQGTSFQQQVWRCLTEIPFGSSASYMDISMSLQNPKAVRAVGAANGSNKIAIIIPCHRVIGSDGSLTGYAYGVDKKKWLLQHESHPLYKNIQLGLF